MTADLIIRSILERKNFAAKRPILPMLNQSSSYRILTDVMPFLGIGFSAPQKMVKEAFLKMRRPNLFGSQSFRQYVLQGFHPFGQHQSFVINGHEKMRMI